MFRRLMSEKFFHFQLPFAITAGDKRSASPRESAEEGESEPLKINKLKK